MAEYNAADRKHIRAAEKAAAIAERQHREVVVEMMATPQRRRYIWEKLAEAHVFSVPFYSDSGQMYFSEGERNAGTKLLADIMECCPEQFILAMRESNARRTSDASRPDHDRTADTGERPSGEDGDGGVEGQPLGEDTGASALN